MNNKKNNYYMLFSNIKRITFVFFINFAIK